MHSEQTHQTVIQLKRVFPKTARPPRILSSTNECEKAQKARMTLCHTSLSRTVRSSFSYSRPLTSSLSKMAFRSFSNVYFNDSLLSNVTTIKTCKEPTLNTLHCEAGSSLLQLRTIPTQWYMTRRTWNLLLNMTLALTHLSLSHPFSCSGLMLLRPRDDMCKSLSESESVNNIEKSSRRCLCLSLSSF